MNLMTLLIMFLGYFKIVAEKGEAQGAGHKG
jgi:hypothetical protein